MKRRILVTVLALLLALGALVTLNSGISRTALPIEMQVLTSLGDSGAAQGLMVDYRIALDSCLLWYTKYDPASGANRTDFHVTSHRETTTVLPYGLLGEEYNDWWIVSGLLDERDTRDPIVSGILNEAASGQGRENSRGTSGSIPSIITTAIRCVCPSSLSRRAFLPITALATTKTG